MRVKNIRDMSVVSLREIMIAVVARSRAFHAQLCTLRPLEMRLVSRCNNGEDGGLLIPERMETLSY